MINGGIADDDAIAGQLAAVDGVMVGRDAYHHPWAMAGWDHAFFGDPRRRVRPRRRWRTRWWPTWNASTRRAASPGLASRGT